MKDIHDIKFQNGTKQELLSDLTPDFPYIASRVELDKFTGCFVPWHWHKEVELFYLQSGVLEYYTSKGKTVFPAGSGGLINSNILHMTRAQDSMNTVQFLHIFDTSFIAGKQGSRMEQRYITPIIAAPQIEIIALYPDHLAQIQLLNKIHESFNLSESDFGYEMKLRAILSDIWLHLLTMSLSSLEKKGHYNKINDKIKLMMIYIHEHYAEKISIAEIAAAAFSSERECFRAFRHCLHMTPAEYIKSYRLQMACSMLAESRESITGISHACGLGSSSYFGQVFREHIGCTPIEYRKKWRNSDI
ncbi:AraC family transcriptional regulator [Acetonema longum]|uniref:Transcriptional regulator, AraC family protein n=1 Tax=Acetonema longum DSM 6540 TaxID=1009370 RepID=F7NDB1_9FIRM|nr:AraC family transcriptional regulator [Acetonema longum]EGO65943.1 transcriptional regulator, AraC family protein [Acetonema longum DSM 6540]